MKHKTSVSTYTIKVDSVLEWINSILFRLMLHHYLMRTKRSDDGIIPRAYLVQPLCLVC